MALVSYIIGDCPGCGRKDSFGNVNVTGNALNRGCLSCRYWTSVPLPPLNKRVIYLDQYFFSHAFRGGEIGDRFIAARERVLNLAGAQLLVAPYSSVHEEESRLWTSEQREHLFKFIKQTSGGHKFRSDYEIHQRQIHRAFDAFVAQKSAMPSIEKRDALPSDINDWDDYVWIDVNSYRPDPDEMRARKEESVDGLLALFPVWATSKNTFEEDLAEEMMSGADAYIRHYLEYVERVGKGDYRALLDASASSMIIESLMHDGRGKLPPEYRLQRIRAFLDSTYSRQVPVEKIGAELFALLRQQIQHGAHSNLLKARKRFKGVFSDIRFITTYAPYCDAMLVDNLMYSWVSDPRINLSGRYGTRFFCRTNWSSFLDYLDEIERNRSPEVDEALEMIHPSNAKRPEWNLNGSSA